LVWLDFILRHHGDGNTGTSRSSYSSGSYSYTSTATYIYDEESGLTKSYTTQTTGNSNGTPFNNSSSVYYTIVLLGEEDGPKEDGGGYKNYKVTPDIGDYYTTYKINNDGIIKQSTSYSSQGGATTTYYTFPDIKAIREKLPKLTVSFDETCVLVSDTNTYLRIRFYDNTGTGSYREEEYRRIDKSGDGGVTWNNGGGDDTDTDIGRPEPPLPQEPGDESEEEY
jgi:hypothetical protein